MPKKTPAQRAQAIRASYVKRLERAEKMRKKWTDEVYRLERERSDKELALFDSIGSRRKK